MFKKIRKNSVSNNSTLLNPVEPNSETLIENQVEPVIENIFPPAEEISQKASSKWTVVSDSEILKKIIKKSEAGERYADFYNSIISESSVEKLRQQGYDVHISELCQTPYFKVSW